MEPTKYPMDILSYPQQFVQLYLYIINNLSSMARNATICLNVSYQASRACGRNNEHASESTCSIFENCRARMYVYS